MKTCPLFGCLERAVFNGKHHTSLVIETKMIVFCISKDTLCDGDAAVVFQGVFQGDTERFSAWFAFFQGNRNGFIQYQPGIEGMSCELITGACAILFLVSVFEG